MLTEATPVRGCVKGTIQAYILGAEAGILRAIGEVTQELEKDVQAEVPGTVAMSTQQTQALVGTVRGELQAQIEAGH